MSEGETDRRCGEPIPFLPPLDAFAVVVITITALLSLAFLWAAGK